MAATLWLADLGNAGRVSNSRTVQTTIAAGGKAAPRLNLVASASVGLLAEITKPLASGYR